VWSNPSWKNAALRGAADASARVDASIPALVLGVPPNIRRSVHKLLGSQGFKAEVSDGGLSLTGREELERFFRDIGTDNPLLRDQWDAFCGGSAALPLVPPPPPPPPSSTAPEAAAPAQEAHPSKKRAPRSRRTLYRGRPGA
jgi:hypothetical protein